MASDPCIKCDNKTGFVFGTCCQCGWNSLKHDYEWIRVYTADLSGIDDEYRDNLINRHNYMIVRFKK